MEHAVRQENGANDGTTLKDQQAMQGARDNVSMVHPGTTVDVSTTYRGMRRRDRCQRWLLSNLFLLLTFIGIIGGFIIGLTARLAHPSSDAVIWIGIPGELYMRILQAMIVPLVVCTVIDGTANTDPKSNGRIGLVTMVYIMLTNALGVIVGIALCLIIKPGSTRSDVDKVVAPDTRNLQTIDIFADFIRNLFPDNIIAAATQMSQTKYVHKEDIVARNVSGFLVNTTSVQVSKSLTTVPGTNILGLIILSAAVGIAASQAREKTRPLVDFFNAGARIIFKLFDWAKWLTPVGVASLIARALVKVENISSAFSSMGLFVLTTSGGCLLYQWVVLSIILLVVTRRNPFKFISHAAKPWLLAFGPAASAITLPEMMRVSLEVYKVDPRVAGFTLPFCVTLNRDGSCLFIAATCLFVAQYSGATLSTGDVFTIAVLTTISSSAIAAVPSSSIVVILIILKSLGIPSHSIGLVLAVDWLNDRFRTATNVVCHLVAALVTWRMCKTSLIKRRPDESVDVFRGTDDL